MQVGDALSGGWDIYKRFWRHLIPIALVVYLAISLIALLLVAIAGFLGALVSILVGIVGVFLLQGALVEAVADVRDGRADLSLGETLGRVWPRVPALAGASILAGIAILIGFVLLLVPGFYLLTIWSLITPVIVLERRRAMESFGRSRELVRGYGWTVFGVILITFVTLAIVGIVISIILTPLQDDVQNYVSDVISNTLFGPFVAAVWTEMYFRLRGTKEAEQPVAAGAAFTE
jgi:hypothetical protein